jgi:RNA polymerase-binding protein DksA
MLELTGACGAGGLISVKRARRPPGYAGAMKPWQRNQLRRALEQRRETLLDELKRDAARLREERSGDIGDIGDESVADLLVDLDQADLSRDAGELREIEAARRRLDDGTYGICADCGAAIDFERLRAEPAAARCVECQARHEKTYRR